ncbi:MAG: hypothetical protein AAF970_15375 [Bacteroidota bacterium]
MEPSKDMEMVRDLILGPQSRQFEQRVAALEARMVQEIAGLKDEFKRRLDTLESYTRQELATLEAGLSTEREERLDAAGEGEASLQTVQKTLQRKLDQAQTQSREAERTLRTTILDQGKAINDDLERLTERLTGTLDTAVAELRRGKTDRAALSALFTELALRLDDDDAA